MYLILHLNYQKARVSQKKSNFPFSCIAQIYIQNAAKKTFPYFFLFFVGISCWETILISFMYVTNLPIIIIRLLVEVTMNADIAKKKRQHSTF